ncbi:TPA: aminotransferase class I/II-fold pyridoxal phosphate-dependent enzyme, partial [Legionella pneumophila]|nr:aminotransferase class I/II-fold pyridoxal phosphate-dependent enzyme [Legionella pneumophila]
STSLEIITQEEWRRTKLQTNADFLREALSCQGVNIGGSKSQIIPLVTGSEANTLWLRDELEKEDVFGAVFCSPATPKNKCLIRLSISANHEKSDLLRVIDCLAKLARKRPEIPLFKSK